MNYQITVEALQKFKEAVEKWPYSESTKTWNQTSPGWSLLMAPTGEKWPMIVLAEAVRNREFDLRINHDKSASEFFDEYNQRRFAQLRVEICKALPFDCGSKHIMYAEYRPALIAQIEQHISTLNAINAAIIHDEPVPLG